MVHITFAIIKVNNYLMYRKTPCPLSILILKDASNCFYEALLKLLCENVNSGNVSLPNAGSTRNDLKLLNGRSVYLGKYYKSRIKSTSSKLCQELNCYFTVTS